MLAPILILIFMIIVVIIYFWLTYDDNDVGEHGKIHRSGHYSIVRTSPREDLESERISREDLTKQAEEMNLSISVVDDYFDVLEKNIKTIEESDKREIDFFIFNIESSNENLHNMYVKRKDIVRNSNLIPPYHLKDRSELLAEADVEKIEDYIKVPSNIETSMFKK